MREVGERGGEERVGAVGQRASLRGSDLEVRELLEDVWAANEECDQGGWVQTCVV